MYGGMSALGQRHRPLCVHEPFFKTQFGDRPESKADIRLLMTMSALPPKADMCGATKDVRFGPKADIHGVRDPLTERFSLRQELCRIPSIVKLMFSALFGWFADDDRASGKIFWLPMLTANRLRKVLSYVPATGIFRWKVSVSTRAPVGTIAGAKNVRGFRQIRIDGPYSASRLAWLYMTGKWPNSDISYINGKPSDTRWANLQEATSSPNRNRPKRK
jgi:hypothetical protein